MVNWVKILALLGALLTAGGLYIDQKPEEAAGVVFAALASSNIRRAATH